MEDGHVKESVVIEAGTPIRVGAHDYDGGIVKEWRVWASVAVKLHHLMHGKADDKVRVDGVTLRLVDGRNDSVLCVVRGSRGANRVVAFHRAVSGPDALEGFVSRRKAGTVQWRDDTPQRADDRPDGEAALGAPPAV